MLFVIASASCPLGKTKCCASSCVRRVRCCASRAISVVLQDPRMVRHVRERHPRVRVFHQKPRDQVLGVVRDGQLIFRRPLQVDLLDAPIRVRVRVRLKGGRPHQELVAEDAERPDVDALVVRFAFHHLRRKVVQGPAERLTPRSDRVHGPPKVCNLQLPQLPHQEVLRLDVPMDHVLRVAVRQRAAQLQHVAGALPLREALLRLKDLVQLSPGSVL
eukprot:scaffold770_cov255-Pinguiococcus_pyrenoidosus.AAC.27